MNSKSQKRKKRISTKIRKNATRLRLRVFRSNKYVYGQIIDDTKGQTLVSASDADLKGKKITSQEKMTKKVAVAFAVGKVLAAKAKEKGIEKVVYDRGSYKYHGRVKALAEGAREGGLQF